MGFFRFRRKEKTAERINRLRGVLDVNPEDTNTRLALAALYLEAGDQAAAITEYRCAAKQLSDHGLDLESIAVYRKILSLDDVYLTKESLACLKEAEELLAGAKKAYEEAFRPELQDDKALMAPPLGGEEKPLKGDSPGEEGTPPEDDSEPVPIETILARSPDKASPLHDVGEKSAAGEPPEIHNGLDTEAPHPERGPKFDKSRVEVDDNLEAMVAALQVDPPEIPLPLGDGPDIAGQERSTGGLVGFEGRPEVHGSLSCDAAEAMVRPSRTHDPLLPYNLGVTLYERGLTDQAIKEFVKAHNQGVKAVESLSMLAKCYQRKGLFHNAVGFIGQALRADTLTKDQAAMLEAQLEKLKAKVSL